MSLDKASKQLVLPSPTDETEKKEDEKVALGEPGTGQVRLPAGRRWDIRFARARKRQKAKGVSIRISHVPCIFSAVAIHPATDGN